MLAAAAATSAVGGHMALNSGMKRPYSSTANAGVDLQYNKTDMGLDFFGVYDAFLSKANPEMSILNTNDGIDRQMLSFNQWKVEHPDIRLAIMKAVFKSANHPIFKKLLPIEYTEAGVITRETFRFPINFIEKTARGTLTRNNTMTKSTIEGRNHYTALGYLTSMETNTTEEGMLIEISNQARVIGAIWQGVLLDTAAAVLRAAPYNNQPNQVWAGTHIPTTQEEYLDAMSTRYSIINRQPQAYGKVANFASAILEQSSGPAAYCMMDAKDFDFIKHMDQTNTDVRFAGKGAIRTREDVTAATNSTTVSYGGLEGLSLPRMASKRLHNDESEDEFRFKTAIGSHWAHTFNFYDVPAKEYKTSMSHVWTPSWETSDWDCYSFEFGGRHSAQFIPFNADVNIHKGGGKNEREGEIDREYMERLADEKIKRGTYMHTTGRTSYATCKESLDVLFSFNEHVKANDDLSFYTIYAIGELGTHTSAKYFDYMIDSFEHQVFKNITAKEKDSFESGLKLMDALKYDIANRPEYSADVIAVGLQTTNTNDFVAPNKFGGLDVDAVKFDGTKMGGMGTVAGFLTIANLATFVLDRNGNKEFYFRGTAATGYVAERMNVIVNFLAVFRKMANNLYLINPRHDALRTTLLPRYNRHADMKEEHKMMIAMEGWLLGGMKVPVVFNLGEETGNPAATNNILDDQPSKETLQANEIAQKHFKVWETSAFGNRNNTFGHLENALANVGLYESIRDEIQASMSKGGKSAPQSRLSTARQNEIGVLMSTGPFAGTAAFNTLDKVISYIQWVFADGLLDSLKFIHELFQRQSGALPDAQTAGVGAAQPAMPVGRLAKVESTATILELSNRVTIQVYKIRTTGTSTTFESSTGLNNNRTDVGRLNLKILQLHFADSVIRSATDTVRGKLWTAGVSINRIAPTNKFEWVVDQERFREERGALFNEHYTNMSSTIMSYGWLIDTKIPSPPCSGYYLSKKEHAVELANSVFNHNSDLDKRTMSRYVTGYPLTETKQFKRDMETAAIKRYESMLYKLTSEQQIIKEYDLAKLKLGNFFLHGLSRPYSGHPDSTKKSLIDTRWEESFSGSACRGFAARALLMCAANLHTLRSFSANNIPPFMFFLYVRPWETRYQKCAAWMADQQLGNTFLDTAGIEQVTSMNTTTHKKFDAFSLAHQTMVWNNQAFHITPNIKGDTEIGGCGKHAVNEGISRRDMPVEWKTMTQNLGNAEKIKNNSIICIGVSLKDAQTTPAWFDIRGDWRVGDFPYIDAKCQFMDRRNAPTYGGQFLTLEAYKINVVETPWIDTTRMSTFQLKDSWERNYICGQAGSRTYSHTAPDKTKIKQARHMMGHREKGCRDLESSNAPVQHGFQGGQLQYLLREPQGPDNMDVTKRVITV